MRARDLQVLFLILVVASSMVRLSGGCPFIVDGIDSAGDEAVVSVGTMKVKPNPNKA